MDVEVRPDGRIVRTVTLADQRKAPVILTDDNVAKERKPRMKRETRMLATLAEVQELKARMATARRYVEPVTDAVHPVFVDPAMVHGPNGWYLPTGKNLNQWQESLEND